MQDRQIVPSRIRPLPHDRHAIYAYLTTGVRVRVSPNMTYDSAIRVFYGADLAAGNRIEEQRLVVGDFAGIVRWFVVRSASDPNWPNAQPPHDVDFAMTRDNRIVAEFLCGDRNDLPFACEA
jgi:hypothetical protein